jgi:Uri superfamily endonuclease
MSVAGKTAKTDALPSGRGSYIVWLHLAAPARMVVGRLGARDFAAGHYAYAGSARGPGGLATRLRHHLGIAPRPHWHLDYLRRQAKPREIWVLLDDRNHEHRLAARLAACKGAVLPVPGFGSSDCRCATHLFHFTRPLRLGTFNRLAGERGAHPLHTSPGALQCVFQ